MTKLVVTIPAYNEEKSLGDVIRDVPRNISGIDKVEVLVVDDGSTDKTVQVAQDAGADRIVSHTTNQGLGNTFKTAINTALEMDADIIVNTDADNQYNSKEIPKLVQPVLDKEADITLGNRQVLKRDHMPFGKKVGNKMATYVTKFTSGLKISDAQTGFRAFSRDAALQMNLLGGYTYVQETLIQASHKGLNIKEVPVEFRKREGESRLIPSIWSYAKKAGMTILKTYRDYNPLKTFTAISFVFLLASAGLGALVFKYYLETGQFSGRTGTGLLAAMSFITATLVFCVGLLADMLKRNREIQEKALQNLKQE